MSDQQELLSTEPVSATVSFDDESRVHLRSAESSLMIAREFTIESHDDCQEAINERNANLREVQWLENRLDFVLAPFTEGVKRVRAIFKPMIDRRRDAIAHLNPLIVSWEMEQRRLEDIAAKKREEEARRVRQETERKAAAAHAEAEEKAAQERRAAEILEAQRKQAEEDGNQQAAQDAARKAAELREQADHTVETANAEVAQMTLEAAATPSEAPPPRPVMAGNQLRTKWVAELMPTYTEEQAKFQIVRAIASENRMDLLGVIRMDMPALQKIASGLKKNMSVPGYMAIDRPIAAGSKR